MPRWIVRCSCEYSIVVDAYDETDALEKAAELDMTEWDTVDWSTNEAELEEESEDVQP